MEKVNDDYEIHRTVLHDLLLTTENILKGVSFITTNAFSGYLECKILSAKNHPTVIIIYDNSQEEESGDERSKNSFNETELKICELSENQNFIFPSLQSIGIVNVTGFELKKIDTNTEKDQVVIDDQAAYNENLETTEVQFSDYIAKNELDPICEIEEPSFNEENCLSGIGEPSSSLTQSPSGMHSSSVEEGKPSCSYTENGQNFPTTKQKPFVCNYCHKAFGTKHLKIKHMRIHTGEKFFKCSYCEKRFIDSTNKLRHERSHTGEKPYKCEYCDSRFNHPSRKKEHLRIHTGERPYKCDSCKMTFTSAQKKKIHERVHTGEKPYSCSFCGKHFQSNFSKKCHENIHTGERFHCDYCDQTFSQKSSKKNHEKRMHLTDIPNK